MHSHAHLTRRALFARALPGALLAPYAFPQNAPDMAERFRQMSADYERKGLAEPFQGITTNGTVQPGLFGIHSTRVPPRRCATRRLTSSNPK